MKRFLLILASLLFASHGYAQYSGGGGGGVSSATLVSATNANLTASKAYTVTSTNANLTVSKAFTTGECLTLAASIVSSTNANLTVALAKIVVSTNANLTVAKAYTDTSTNAVRITANAYTDTATNHPIYIGAATVGAELDVNTMQVFADGVAEKVDFTNTVIDTGGLHDAANARLVIPKAGAIQISVQSFWEVEEHVMIFMWVYTNGAISSYRSVARFQAVPGNASTESSMLFTQMQSLPVEAGMILEIYLAEDEPGSEADESMYGTPNLTEWSWIYQAD